jgi:S-layer protein Slr4
MFKKTLLALAIAGLSTSAMAANTITTTAAKISAQTLTAAKTTTVQAVTVKLDNAYDSVLLDDAKLIVTISGAVFNSGTTAKVLTGTGSSAFDSTVAPVNAGTTLTFVLDNKAGAINAADTDTIVIPTLPVILDTLTSTVKYAISFQTSGSAAISGPEVAATTIATVNDEWSATYTNLDAQIDVAAANKKFTGAAVTDSLVVDFSDIDTGSAVSQVKEIEITLKGDFNGITSVADGGNAYVVNAAKTEALFTYTGLTLNDITAADKTIVLTIPGTAALVERTFSADVSLKYGASSTKFVVAADKAVGSWKFNSSSTTMNYVPFGPNTQLIVNATSSFATDASFDVTYTKADGTVKLLEDVGTVTAKTVTKLGDMIAAAIMADDSVTSGKTKVTVSVNAPDGNVTFFTGFKDKTNGDRMSLAQVDTNAADAKTAAEANKATLESTTKGLAKTYDAALAAGAAATLTNINKAVTTLVTVYDAAAALYPTDATANTISLAELNAICALANSGATTYVLKTAAGVAIVDNGAATATDTCQ